MPKIVIKTQDGRYLKLPPEDVAVNRDFLRIGAQIKTTPYNYKTREAADEAFAMINEYVRQNKRTEEERKEAAKDWRYTKYVDAQEGCEIVEL